MFEAEAHPDVKPRQLLCGLRPFFRGPVSQTASAVCCDLGEPESHRSSFGQNFAHLMVVWHFLVLGQTGR